MAHDSIKSVRTCTGCASEATLLQHQQLLLRLGQARAAADAAEAACSAQPSSLALWQRCLLLHSQLSQVIACHWLFAVLPVALPFAQVLMRGAICCLNITCISRSTDGQLQHTVQETASTPTCKLPVANAGWHLLSSNHMLLVTACRQGSVMICICCVQHGSSLKYKFHMQAAALAPSFA